jgi:hypothetical protein
MIKLSGLVKEALGKPGQVIPNPYARAFAPMKEETIVEQDHEVSMAQNSLDSIIKNANELKQKVGEMEKNIPGWIQDHITNSENYIEQANSGYHELGEAKLNEASEIKFEELTSTHQKQIKGFEQVLNGKHTVIFEGIHGIIVDIKISNPLGVYRFDAGELKKLLALKIRWIEADKNIITIGF